jgi:hypothetical protein
MNRETMPAIRREIIEMMDTLARIDKALDEHGEPLPVHSRQADKARMMLQDWMDATE